MPFELSTIIREGQNAYICAVLTKTTGTHKQTKYPQTQIMLKDNDYRQILEGIRDDVKEFSYEGKQADYIPALARVNPNQFGMCLRLVDGKEFAVAQADTAFSIQSISKVFALAMAISLKGEGIWSRVGKEPSGTAFNSLVQLEAEKGLPRNPFINAGAMVIADVLLSSLPDARQSFLDLMREISDNPDLSYDEEIALSEREYGYLNAAIVNLLKYPGRYSVAVWSPRLNSKGNSVMGMKALELLTTRTKESIF